MKQMLQTLNRSLSEVQVQKLFCAADVNQNGTVELDEFIDFVMHGKQAVAKVLQEPPQGTPTTVGIRDEWKKQTLEAHNAYRKEHGSADLQWSDECYLSAKKQANACQEKSAMFHDNCSGPSGRHGQNIFWCSAPGSSAERMVKAWYDEIVSPGYDFAKATFTPGTGHFTQVVWKGPAGLQGAVLTVRSLNTAMFERVAFILALAWGAREPEDASMMQMQKKPQAKKLHFLSMGLVCLYQCKGCEGQVSQKFKERVDRMCSGQPDRSIIKTVALFNASTLLRIPLDDLKEQKFVLMLRDPRSMKVYTEKNRCKRELELALTIKDLAVAVGNDNVRTIFYEHWSRDLRKAVQEVADWANVTFTEDMKNVSSTRENDAPSAWLMYAPKGTMWRAEDSPWCRHFFKLVGYPFSAEIPKVPENSTWQERKEALPYDTLRDPAHVPMTAEERQILQDLGSTHVGMALSEDGRFCVANYFPAGNVMGHFKENVLPRGSPYVKESVDQCCGAFLCWSEKLCEMECKGQPLAV
ncbi:Probable pathogenesis-related protein CaO19.6200 [Durusdinium trenchii]|uniref:Probable pathogenesis-related protein CaO19.6200 n=1 Tax=Durusdinium trenchii TaxID=1381693 RepID=A0ABP0NH89_9DINO